jgi:hypothetical protein
MVFGTLRAHRLVVCGHYPQLKGGLAIILILILIVLEASIRIRLLPAVAEYFRRLRTRRMRTIFVLKLTNKFVKLRLR